VGVIADAAPTSVEELRAIVREATGARTPLRLVGAGTWLDAGRPVPSGGRVSLGNLCGIVAYTPGDLTLTAHAGTPMAEIDRITAEHGQWLGLDPFGSEVGTIGATVATASTGPLATGMGLPRDLVLGVEIVNGTGDVVRGGGRVVKNVAGFDLTRLAVGSWGTLGAITEVTVRLRALPECDETLVLTLPPKESLGSVALRMRETAIAPIAIEAISTSLAASLGVGDAPSALVRIAGNAPSVAGQHAALETLGDTRPVETAVWSRLRGIDRGDTAVVRYSVRPSRIGDAWRAALTAAEAIPGAAVHATVTRGVARCVLPSRDVDALRRALERVTFDGSRVFERLPTPLWSELAPSSFGDRLSAGIKRVFDPAGVLNPGIL
jgi:glycolate oxidase FAD binding subunit